MSHSYRTSRCWRRPTLARKGLVAVCGGLLVVVAQAAAVSAPEPAVQPNGMAASTSGGTALDRALLVDTQSGQRNLDLLLESRTAGEAVDAAEPPPAGKPPARAAVVLLPQAQAQGRGQAPVPANVDGVTLGAVPSAGPSAGPNTALPAAVPRLLSADTAGATVQRDWLGATPGGVGLVDSTAQPAVPGMPMVGDNTSRAARWTNSDAARDTDPGLRGTAVMELARFLREHRYWLLGGLAVVGALVAGLQAFGRRSAARQPQRPDPAARDMAQHRSPTRHRHRHRS